MDKIKILWADDEIESLRSQIMFLENKGYEVVTVSNGHDAIEECSSDNSIDVVFLDESMPGLTGLDTLERIKEIAPNLPVVMITKNEAENVMEQAIGSQIADYLIKPVNPLQVLSSLRKIVDQSRLVREKVTTDYQQEFRHILMAISNTTDYHEWVEVYKRILRWELQLDASNTTEMSDILSTQKSEANIEFSKFILKNYQNWFAKPESGPVMSYNLLREKVFPHIGTGTPSLLLVLDNLRYDQWKTIEPILSQLFRVEEEESFFSILPTATQYSRNAIFSGLMPADIEKRFPQYWLNDHEEGGKNQYEHELLTEQLKRVMRKPIKHDYIKVTNVQSAKELEDNILNYMDNDLSVIVYNFIDMLSHARTEMEVLKELAGDEKAYRDLTRTWFMNSPLWAALQKLAGKKIKLFVTTDHGTIRVTKPSKLLGDREITTNLRYKTGRTLQFDKKDVLEIRNPKDVGLPTPFVNSSFVFAKESLYFVYPQNYNHFVNFFRNTFQHGGISLEEMIVPVIRLSSK